MGVWVVVGGQYGSEGKGKIAAFITRKEKIDICVRCGGPNSGHCFVDDDGRLRSLRQIPTGFVRPETRLLIPPGGLLDLEVLKGELDTLHLGPDRVGVDYRTMIIEERDRETERILGLRERLSSTLCGVGSAISRRVLRGEDVCLAERAASKFKWLRQYLTDVPAEINAGIDDGKRVLVEGTQGFGLSLYHSSFYPKTTSRDTSAAALISECGVGPLAVTDVVMVLRTFPIRVTGAQAGPLADEIDWQTIQNESGYRETIGEFTTVTKSLRRVGRFDFALAKQAVQINRPNHLAINFLDYLDHRNRFAHTPETLSQSALDFIGKLEETLQTPVKYAGVGPSLSETLNIFDHTSIGQNLVRNNWGDYDGRKTA